MSTTVQTLTAQYLANLDYDGDQAKTLAALQALRGLRVLRAQGITGAGSGLNFASLDAEIALLEKAAASFNRSSFTRVRPIMS